MGSSGSVVEEVKEPSLPEIQRSVWRIETGGKIHAGCFSSFQHFGVETKG